MPNDLTAAAMQAPTIRDGWTQALPELSAMAEAVENECNEVAEAIARAVEQDPLAEGITAYYLGMRLNNNVDRRARLYLAGSALFEDSPDGDPDWACEFEWEPEEGRYYSRVLYDLEWGASDSDSRDAQLVFAALIVSAVVRRVGPGPLLGGADKVAVAVGHDDGDVVLVADIVPGGLIPRAEGE